MEDKRNITWQLNNFTIRTVNARAHARRKAVLNGTNGTLNASARAEGEKPC